MIQYSAFACEIWLVLGAMLILVVDLCLKASTNRSVLNTLSVLAVLGALLSLPCPGEQCCTFSCYAGHTPLEAFNGFLKTDSLAVFFKCIILLATLFTLLMTFRYFKARPTRYPAEFLAILLFSAAGATALASAQEIITLYVALETLTISSYLLAAFLKKEPTSNEAGMKYLLIGAFSSALLLFGFSYLYGLTGTTVIADIAKGLEGQYATPLVVLTLVLIVAGLAFKISLAPFHMWTPDVYQGAPTPVTAYLSIASKTAGFAAFIRLFWTALDSQSIQPVWAALFALLAALSIILGNLEALKQDDLKRLMAYSSIAQAGYISVGFLTGKDLGIPAVLFYLFTYLFANMGVFLVLVIVSSQTGSDKIDDYAGVAKKSPLLGAVLAVCLLSLAGVPPFAGFTGKWNLFFAALSQGYAWLAFIGLGLSVASAYYYLRVVRQAFIREPKDDRPLTSTWVEKTVLWACLIVTLLLGFWPTPIMNMAQAATASLF